jgi:hypothetical protein
LLAAVSALNGKVRVRAYPFGGHLSTAVGHGTLVSIPVAVHPGERSLFRGQLVQAAFGPGVDFAQLDFGAVQLFLMPDGEEVHSVGA